MPSCLQNKHINKPESFNVEQLKSISCRQPLWGAHVMRIHSSVTLLFLHPTRLRFQNFVCTIWTCWKSKNAFSRSHSSEIIATANVPWLRRRRQEREKFRQLQQKHHLRKDIQKNKMRTLAPNGDPRDLMGYKVVVLKSRRSFRTEKADVELEDEEEIEDGREIGSVVDVVNDDSVSSISSQILIRVRGPFEFDGIRKPGRQRRRLTARQREEDAGVSHEHDRPSEDKIASLRVATDENVEVYEKGEGPNCDFGDVEQLQVEHLIPFVHSIIPRIDTGSRVIYIDPPKGLLDLGNRKALLQHLEVHLEPFAAFVDPRLRIRRMPTRRQLEEAGRKDLVRLIIAAGGFLDVATTLGFRSARRPPGYWENESNLDRELSMFVAAHWIKFEGKKSKLRQRVPDTIQSSTESMSLMQGRQMGLQWYTTEDDLDDDEETDDDRYQEEPTYWYNQVTHKLSWEEPTFPEAVNLDDSGSVLLAEDDDDRVMPSRSIVQASGRYDLHAAIMASGGYRAVAKALERRPSWPPSLHLHSFRAFARELQRFIRDEELLPEMMPTPNELLSLGRSDLHQAVIRHGGYIQVARKLRIRSRRQPSGAWKDLESVVKEIRRFALNNGCFNEISDVPHNSRNSRGNDGHAEESDVEKGLSVEISDSVAAAADGERGMFDLRMPTHEELRKMGRHDLRHALQRHGSKKVAALAGLKMDGRGRRKGMKRELKAFDTIDL